MQEQARVRPSYNTKHGGAYQGRNQCLYMLLGTLRMAFEDRNGKTWVLMGCNYIGFDYIHSRKFVAEACRKYTGLSEGFIQVIGGQGI